MELRFNIVSQSNKYLSDDAECYKQLVEKTAIDKDKRCTFFDFCAGIGSAHLAFKYLNCDCVWYSEIDKKAEKTYKLFFGNSIKNYGDLTRIDCDQLTNFDIVLAGFPC